MSSQTHLVLSLFPERAPRACARTACTVSLAHGRSTSLVTRPDVLGYHTSRRALTILRSALNHACPVSACPTLLNLWDKGKTQERELGQWSADDGVWGSIRWLWVTSRRVDERGDLSRHGSGRERTSAVHSWEEGWKVTD